jgi:hypothetical protein
MHHGVSLIYSDFVKGEALSVRDGTSRKAIPYAVLSLPCGRAPRSEGEIRFGFRIEFGATLYPGLVEYLAPLPDGSRGGTMVMLGAGKIHRSVARRIIDD